MVLKGKQGKAQVSPVLAREGIVPKERARFSRPGREEEDVRRGERKSCWLDNWSTLGGVGMNIDGDTGGYGKPISDPVGKVVMVSPERYL